jgi:hypothetical protein
MTGFQEDADEAGKCFAVGRYTACVFHLMRIMERCVQKMGRDLGVYDKIVAEKGVPRFLVMSDSSKNGQIARRKE